MPAPSWVTTEDWEVLYLGGKRMPGVARVEVSIASGLDIQKPKGAKRARIRDTGTPPAELQIELEFNADELPGLDLAIGMLRPRAAFAPRSPLQISHPQARLWGVNNVVIGPVGAPQPSAGSSYRLKISSTEWVPETKKVKKASTKPANAEEEDWSVQPLIDALRPGATGAAQDNFSSADQLFSGG